MSVEVSVCLILIHSTATVHHFHHLGVRHRTGGLVHHHFLFSLWMTENPSVWYSRYTVCDSLAIFNFLRIKIFQRLWLRLWLPLLPVQMSLAHLLYHQFVLGEVQFPLPIEVMAKTTPSIPTCGIPNKCCVRVVLLWLSLPLVQVEANLLIPEVPNLAHAVHRERVVAPSISP